MKRCKPQVIFDGAEANKRWCQSYACLIAVRPKDKDQPWLPPLVQVYQSDEVKKFVQSTFNGAMLAGG